MFRRAVAAFIDFWFLFFVYFWIARQLGWTEIRYSGEQVEEGLFGLKGFAFILLMLLSIVLQEYFFSRTIGKLLFKLKVITDSGKISFKQAVIRNIYKLPSAGIVFNSLFGISPPHPKTYGLLYHDFKADTEVAIG